MMLYVITNTVEAATCPTEKPVLTKILITDLSLKKDSCSALLHCVWSYMEAVLLHTYTIQFCLTRNRVTTVAVLDTSYASETDYPRNHDFTL